MGNRRIFAFGLAGASALAHVRAASGQTPDPSQPPRLVLRASDGEQRAAIGTYCWGGKCVDMMSPFYFPACPLLVTQGETLTIEFAALGPLRRISIAVWPYAEDIQPGPPNWSAKSSESPEYRVVVVRPVSPILLPGVLPPGLLVVEVFAQARRGGSTNQGFKLRVLPAHPAATPASASVATPTATVGCTEEV